MTDPTHTTNEEIALELGWEKIQGGKATPYFWLWTDGSTRRNPPDYEHDWAHNGPLQDELWAAGFDLSHDGREGTFYWYNKYGTRLDDDREDTTDLKQATALDWLAWRKEEK